MHGVSSVVAAGLIGHAGDLRNYRNAGAFAAKCGAAPVPCSSGRHVAVRVNRGGDRQLNRLLHVIAVAQVATKAHAGRQYYERKRAEGKTHPSAMRCLKRQLATVVYYRLSAIQDRLAATDLARVHRAVLNRDFAAAGPNQRWVGDTTEFVIGDGGAKLYLAAVLDLFLRIVHTIAAPLAERVTDRGQTHSSSAVADRRRSQPRDQTSPG